MDERARHGRDVTPGLESRFLDVDDFASWGDHRLLHSREAPDETFATFYRRHVRIVLAFYAQRGVDASVAGDLTAETFAAALLARHRYQADRPTARAWLLTIANNKLVDHVRRSARESAARERLQLESVALSQHSRDEFPCLAEEHRREVEEALRELPPAQRSAIEAHVLHGDSYAEIAHRTGSAQSAIRQNVSRGLGRLRSRLEKTR